MCGIAGVFRLRERAPVPEGLLRAKTDAIQHRGPDESGHHFGPGVGLGHRRLSIIDLSSGQQPMYNDDQSVVIIFNGEVYNYPDLAGELRALGYSFRTHSDTEVILRAWEAWGEKSAARLRGMFAYAIYDARRDCLFLARDHLGKKPLYYAELSSGELVFGSELKSLMLHPEFRREIDPEAVEDYFALGYVPEPKTIFRQAKKLPPAHWLLAERGKPVKVEEFWDVPFKPTAPPSASESDVGIELIERLREAVKIRLVSEVPLGAFLSGGVDSSAVVALMAGASKDPVKTCSIAFNDPRFDESAHAQAVSDRYRTQHHVRLVDPDDFSVIDALPRFYDEPFADSSALPTYRVCQIAREQVTVALSGDGGDESLAGYRRYLYHMREQRVRGLLPHWLRAPIFGFLGRVYPKLDWAPRWLRGKTTFQALARDDVQAYFHSVSVLKDDLRRKLYSAGMHRQLAGYNAVEVLRRHAARAPSEHPLSLVQYLDFKTYLVGDILVKVDRASMAHSLEVRAPLLDARLVEWISGLSPDLKLRGAEGKYLFKKALEPLLPRDVLYRQKMGFAVPLISWFRGPLRERVRREVLGQRLLDTGFFERRSVEQLVEQHVSGFRDHSGPLWSLMMFARFLEHAESWPRWSPAGAALAGAVSGRSGAST